MAENKKLIEGIYELQGMEAVLRRFEAANVSYERTVIARKAIVTHSEGRRGIKGRLTCPVRKSSATHLHNCQLQWTHSR